MPRYRCSVQIGSIDVDSPELLDTVKGIFDGVEVLGETSRSHQMIDLAVVCNDFGNRLVDRIRVRDIGVVGCNFGDSSCLSAQATMKRNRVLTSRPPGSLPRNGP